MAKNKPKKDNACICVICNRIIFTNVDNYCHLIDYHKGQFEREGFYHTQCFNDKLKGSSDLSAMKKQTMALLKRAGEMVGLKDEKKMEVVHI